MKTVEVECLEFTDIEDMINRTKMNSTNNDIPKPAILLLPGFMMLHPINREKRIIAALPSKLIG
jgi:hypothetical protein